MSEIDFFLALVNFTKHVRAGESEKRHVQLAKEKGRKAVLLRSQAKMGRSPHLHS